MDSNYKTTADAELLGLIDSDEEAYSELISRHLPAIIRAASIYQQSPADRDDLVSEGILGLMAAARTYSEDRGASFGTYAFVCANRRMLSALKKIRKINMMEGPIEGIEPKDTESPEKTAIEREFLREIFSEAESSFSELERRVLMLYLSGESYERISAALGIDRKAVDNALSRVRAKLRRKFG